MKIELTCFMIYKPQAGRFAALFNKQKKKIIN